MENLFTVQFSCLADWNKAMTMAPWLFRYQVVILEEYDGFEDPRSVVLNQIALWERVLRLLDNLLHDVVIRGMCRPMGKILALQIKLLAGYVGEFVRVRVKIDVTKKLFQFVSITRATKQVWYQVQYDKLPTFCGNCGMLGHWHEECGTGEHDESKLEWGDFILADGGTGRGRGCGDRVAGASRAPARGRGRGGGGRSMGKGGEFHMHTTWHHNQVQRNADGTAMAKESTDEEMTDKDPLSRKRLNFEIAPAGSSALVEPSGRVAAIVG